MPLSEDEERILHEIEQRFYDSDPEFAREVSSATLGNPGRAIRLAVLGFLAGLVVLVVGFTESVFLGFVGFALMVGCGFIFYINAVKLGRAGIQSVSNRAGLGDLIGQRRDRLRQRLRRDDP